MRVPEWVGRDRVAVLAALLGPFAVSVVLVPFRDSFANTSVALVLVLVVVAVAANGYRVAGVLAALSAGVWFDFFFTRPYQRFTISDQADVETLVLLLLVGVGVTELAVWGRRQEARANREAGYLAGIRDAAEVGATGGSSTALIEQVSGQLTRILGLRGCHFQYGAAGLGEPPRLQHDGQVVWKRAVWDVERRGLPVESEIELLVESGGRLRGRFLMSAAHETRVSLAQRLVAVTLADQVGAAMSE
jgi:K+-sensing histidine kinase KdpD